MVRRAARWLPWALLLCGVVLAPWVIPASNAAEILIFAIVAAAANLLIGYAGLFSFGQATFFGIGGYAGGYLLANYQVPMLLALLAGALAGGVAAWLIGAICVRRSGLYFIMLTFAFNQMVYYAAYSWRSVTGGEDGMSGIIRPNFALFGYGVDLAPASHYYILVAMIFLGCFALMQRIVGSPLGKIIMATRDNERRAASIGYRVRQARVLVFALSGAFTGLAGTLYGMLYWIMPIDAVQWLKSGYIVFMVLIGGTSSLFGPVIGAAIFIWMQDFLSTIWARWPLLFGIAVVVVVLFLQGGVIELLGRVTAIARRYRGEAAGRIAPGA